MYMESLEKMGNLDRFSFQKQNSFINISFNGSESIGDGTRKEWISRMLAQVMKPAFGGLFQCLYNPFSILLQFVLTYMAGLLKFYSRSRENPGSALEELRWALEELSPTEDSGAEGFLGLALKRPNCP